MSDRIKVEGVNYPQTETRKEKRRSIFPVLPIHPHNLIWLLAVGAVFASVVVFGTPHLRFSYRYSDLGSGISDGQRYRFHRCDYVGWSPQVFIPNDGRCPIIKWLRAKG